MGLQGVMKGDLADTAADIALASGDRNPHGHLGFVERREIEPGAVDGRPSYWHEKPGYRPIAGAVLSELTSRGGWPWETLSGYPEPFYIIDGWGS